MIRKVEATVYYSERRKRRYFSLDAACQAEARSIISRKYPTEESETDDRGQCTYPGFHWTGLDNAEKLLRRLTRKVKKSFMKTPPSNGIK